MKIPGFLSDIEFYADANDPSVMYAEIVVPAIGTSLLPYIMFVHIDDNKLQSYIRQFVLPNIDEKVSASALIQEAKDLITLSGNPDTVSPRIRTAGKLSDGIIEYDLNSTSRQYVKVTIDGWRLVKKSQNKFLKRNTLGTQVVPNKTSKNLISLLTPYVNTAPDGLVLFTTWIVQAFCHGNHSALLIMAEAGSGKSTLTKMVRNIIDPSNLSANIFPEKKDDLFATLCNAYYIAFDNTEELKKDVSDILCAAITGATIAKRTLYSTNDIGVFELHNAISLNGIDIMPAQSDLASRCLLLSLKPLDEECRVSEDELTIAFSKDLPDILGAIFNTLSKAMKIVPSLAPKRLPRMASAYIEMLAIAIALGVPEAEFERIYFANLAAIDKERRNTAIVEAVSEYMSSSTVQGRSIEGTVTSLYKQICANYSGSHRDLPKSASHFSRKLKQETKALNAAGLTLNFDDTFDDGTHLKIIKNK